MDALPCTFGLGCTLSKSENLLDIYKNSVTVLSMKATYVYRPNMLEYATRQNSLTIKAGTEVRLAKAPTGGRGLPKVFKWIETTDGKFLGMTAAKCLVKKAKV